MGSVADDPDFAQPLATRVAYTVKLLNIFLEGDFETVSSKNNGDVVNAKAMVNLAKVVD